MNLDPLEVWTRAKDFVIVLCREVVPHLPTEEKWNLTQQLKRAAQSIPANVAEGHGRYHFLDNVRFLNSYIAYVKRSKQGEKDFPPGYVLREMPESYPLEDPNA